MCLKFGQIWFKGVTVGFYPVLQKTDGDTLKSESLFFEKTGSY